MLYIEYRNSVLRDFEHKRAEGILPIGLIHPTPAKIRRECVTVLQERFDQRDERSLRAFFGPVEDLAKFTKRVENWDIDEFRPLVNFLKKQTVETDQKNLELLAWLIDFRPRPYSAEETLPDFDHIIKKSLLGISTANSPVALGEDRQRRERNEEEKKGKIKVRMPWLKKAAMIAAVVFPVSVGLYRFSGGALTSETSRELLPDSTKIEKNVSRCQALTTKGTQCKRSADSAGYCWQHLKLLKS